MILMVKGHQGPHLRSMMGGGCSTPLILMYIAPASNKRLGDVLSPGNVP